MNTPLAIIIIFLVGILFGILALTDYLSNGRKLTIKAKNHIRMALIMVSVAILVRLLI